MMVSCSSSSVNSELDYFTALVLGQSSYVTRCNIRKDRRIYDGGISSSEISALKSPFYCTTAVATTAVLLHF